MPRHPRTAVITSYPPSRCGVGRFAHSLVNALCRHGHEIDIVRVQTTGDRASSERGVVLEFDPHAAALGDDQIRAIAKRLDRYDTVVVQHEFGLYGRDDGVLIMDLIRLLTRPVIVTLHTVPATPTDAQRHILEEMGTIAHLVTPSGSARNNLLAGYDVSPDSVSVIPHGTDWTPRPANRPPRRTIVTWGLLGPGKGIERGIGALRHLDHLDPDVVFRVIGQTHPNVLRREGPVYRRSLERLARRYGVADRVVFDEGYKPDNELHAAVAQADVVLLPYDNTEQVSSGVLVDALSVGRPVVATDFPHARELLGTGAGSVVDHRDEPGLAGAIEQLLADEVRYHTAAGEAQRQSAGMTWHDTAARYAGLIRQGAVVNAV